MSLDRFDRHGGNGSDPDYAVRLLESEDPKIVAVGRLLALGYGRTVQQFIDETEKSQEGLSAAIAALISLSAQTTSSIIGQLLTIPEGRDAALHQASRQFTEEFARHLDTILAVAARRRSRS